MEKRHGYKRVMLLIKGGMITETPMTRLRIGYGKSCCRRKLSGDPMSVKLKHCSFNLALNKIDFDI